MPDQPIDLRSVNWSQGMFLTPDHFLRQERYHDSAWLWLVRHALPTSGLLGGGARVDPAEYGAARLDPVVDFDDSGGTLEITVTQCRGITSGGAPVDVDPSRPISARFPKKELEGVLDLGVYVIARPHDKEAAEGLEDAVNPQMQTGRRLRYTVALDVRADDAEWSLLLTRLRRAETGLRFERAMSFIPPSAFMSAHSDLMHAFRQINEHVAALADRYGLLHRAIVDFVGMARTRGLATDQDAETLAFVGRMVAALDACAYEIVDPLQPPRRFFQQVTRLVRSAALSLSLSPPTREYFRLLGEIGEVEFVSMLEQEGQALELARALRVDENLHVDAQKAIRALERLDRLEQALEGKYLDYRISPSLEGLNFVFDRSSGDPVLYKSVAKPARPQAHGQELTFVFAPLRLEARESYRLILVGDRQARFVSGDKLTAELRINPGEGYAQRPDFRTSEYDLDGQRNFAIDFKAPDDVTTINDLRVSLRSAQPIRSAILYVRGRLMPGLAPASPSGPVLGVRGPTLREDRPRPTAPDGGDPSRRRGRLDEDYAAPQDVPPAPGPSGPRRRLS